VPHGNLVLEFKALNMARLEGCCLQDIPESFVHGKNKSLRGYDALRKFIMFGSDFYQVSP
jgi:hypothetical protein